MWTLALSVTVTLGALPPSAGGDLSAAQREVEEQLRQAVRIPEPQLEVRFLGVDASRYALKEESFSLDGVELPVTASGDRFRVFQGAVTPGRHALDVHLVYEERRGFGIFTYADAKVTVEGSLGLKTEKGLRTHLQIRVVRDEKADPKHRLRLASDLSHEMLAKVDDSVGDLLVDQKRLAIGSPVPAEPIPTPRAVPQAPAERAGQQARAAAPLSAPQPRQRRVVREVLGLRSRPAPVVANRDPVLPASPAALLPASTPTAPPAAALPPAPIAAPSPPPSAAVAADPTSSPSTDSGTASRLVALVAIGLGTLVLLGLGVARARRA